MTNARLAARIEKLERQNRQFKILAMILTTITGLFFFSGQASPPSDELTKAITTSDLKLVDERGLVRAQLAMTENGPALNLFDKNEKSRVALILGDDNGGLLLHDGNNTLRTELSLRDNVPMLRFARASGKTGYQAFVSETNGVGCEMNGAAATAGIRLTVTDKGNALVLGDTQGKVRILAGVGIDGETALNVMSKSGEVLLAKP